MVLGLQEDQNASAEFETLKALVKECLWEACIYLFIFQTIQETEQTLRVVQELCQVTNYINLELSKRRSLCCISLQEWNACSYSLYLVNLNGSQVSSSVTLSCPVRLLFVLRSYMPDPCVALHLYSISSFKSSQYIPPFYLVVTWHRWSVEAGKAVLGELPKFKPCTVHPSITIISYQFIWQFSEAVSDLSLFAANILLWQCIIYFEVILFYKRFRIKLRWDLYLMQSISCYLSRLRSCVRTMHSTS